MPIEPGLLHASPFLSELPRRYGPFGKRRTLAAAVRAWAVAAVEQALPKDSQERMTTSVSCPSRSQRTIRADDRNAGIRVHRWPKPQALGLRPRTVDEASIFA